MLLPKISWRNIWRNPKRSLVMVLAIAAGLWGGLFAGAIMTGLVNQRFETSIAQHISHIQIHHPEFIRDEILEHHIDDWREVTGKIASDPRIQAFSARTMLNGMMATANLSQGIQIIGVDPQAEASVTGLPQNIIEGSYLGQEHRQPVLVGKTLAEKTKLREGSRLVLTFQNAEGDLVSGAFRVSGIFQTANTAFDENNVYVLQTDITENLQAGEPYIHEIAILANNPDSLEEIQAGQQCDFPQLSIRTWREVSPELSYLLEMSGVMQTFILGIILFALGFGLVNTMLMSVFERIRELGMLMAVGMNKKRVFFMILMETTYLSIIGGISGVFLALGTIMPLGKKGLDLAVVGGDSMHDFGFPSLIYPTIPTSFFFVLFGLVFLTAMITSIYPALKATRLSPAEAVRAE